MVKKLTIVSGWKATPTKSPRAELPPVMMAAEIVLS